MASSSATAPITVTRAQVARLRLQSLGLHAPTMKTPLEVVRHHLAMQSQDWAASRWAIGSRIAGSVDADVLAAYDRGEIVRSWPQRGTVHAVVAQDLRWMLELMGVRMLASYPRRWEMLGIDEPMLERAREVAVELLRGGGRCTRDELKAAIAEAGIDLTGQRASHTVGYLALTGTIVMGPTLEGKQQLVLLDEWVPDSRVLTRVEALSELGRRYLVARGPATLEDLVHWTKLTKGDCRTALEACADDTVELTCGGVTYVMLREAWERLAADDPAVDRGVHALAAFDEHLLGYRVRDEVLPAEHADRVDPGRNGVFRYTIVAGSRVIATWGRTRRARKVLVLVAPFTSLPRGSRTKVVAAIERWGAFTGTPVEVAVSGE